ncbi:MAG: regulatory protein RecX [Edaphocola sp.]
MEAALKAIRHYCAYQERSHSEVRGKLLSLGVFGLDLEQIMGSLVADDFLNEERFARSYARGKFNVKHWGRRKIIQELKSKQVSEYCIRQGMKEIDETRYHDTLARLATKKWAMLQAERNHWVRQQKLQRYLMQKGFETDLIQDIVKQIALPDTA